MRKRTSKKEYKCKKMNTRKYLNRPSPPYPAAECPGKIMKGNDGNYYISQGSLFAPHRWIKYSKNKKTRKRN
jgi:hypothetical protein